MEIHKIEGSGPPNFIPPFPGVHYNDTTGMTAWISVSSNAISDWLQLTGSRELNTRTVSVNDALESTDYFVILDGNAGPVDLTMISPALYPNLDFHIQAKDVTNTVRLMPFAAETFNGEAFWPFEVDYQAFIIRSDGTNWYVR